MARIKSAFYHPPSLRLWLEHCAQLGSGGEPAQKARHLGAAIRMRQFGL
jgi:hypothetical protein